LLLWLRTHAAEGCSPKSSGVDRRRTPNGKASVITSLGWETLREPVIKQESTNIIVPNGNGAKP
jgi:hypothetical protein